MFYHRIERIVGDNNQDYNELSKHFGFKTQVVRYLNKPAYHYEVFTPCLIKETQRKIDIAELNSLRYKERKLPVKKDHERRSTTLQHMLETGERSAIASPAAEVQCQDHEQLIDLANPVAHLTQREQVIKEILVDDFETDDSMRGINYQDLNSLDSSNEDDE